MDILAIIVITLLILGAINWFLDYKGFRKTTDQLNEVISYLIHGHDNMRKTLLFGLHSQFNRDGVSPTEFENFTLPILEKYYGGKGKVTSKTGDFGVDIEMKLAGELFLFQVKCYKPDNKVDYEPIAIIHSQMVKQNAKRGFVITTSDFTKGALKYTDKLHPNVELINGEQFVQIWAEALEKEVQAGKDLVPGTV